MKVGMGADHGGFEMKQQLAKLLVTEGDEVVDFGNKIYDTNDDYPNFAILLARTLASGDMERAFWCAAAARAPPWLPIRWAA